MKYPKNEIFSMGGLTKLADIGKWDILNDPTVPKEMIADLNISLENFQMQCDRLNIPGIRGQVNISTKPSKVGFMEHGLLGTNTNSLAIQVIKKIYGKDTPLPSEIWKLGDNPNTRPKLSIDYFSNTKDQFEIFLHHEYAHHVIQNSNQIVNEITTITDGATNGSAKSVDEYFAENYALYQKGRDDLVTPSMKKIIRDHKL